jgi:hypothetical protein
MIYNTIEQYKTFTTSFDANFDVKKFASFLNDIKDTTTMFSMIKELIFLYKHSLKMSSQEIEKYHAFSDGILNEYKNDLDVLTQIVLQGTINYVKMLTHSFNKRNNDLITHYTKKLYIL